MKKKKIIVFSLFIVCIVVAAIAATYFMGKNKEKADTVNEFGFESDFKCSTKKVDLESMNFKADKNGSYEESNESFAMTEDGIYYFVDEYLKFYDFSSKKKLLCAISLIASMIIKNVMLILKHQWQKKDIWIQQPLFITKVICIWQGAMMMVKYICIELVKMVHQEKNICNFMGRILLMWEDRERQKIFQEHGFVLIL